MSSEENDCESNLKSEKSSARRRADEIKDFRCKNLIAVIESLNLGTSSGIVLYEVTRQRREYQSKYRLRDHRGKRLDPLPTVIEPSIGNDEPTHGQ